MIAEVDMELGFGIYRRRCRRGFRLVCLAGVCKSRTTDRLLVANRRYRSV